MAPGAPGAAAGVVKRSGAKWVRSQRWVAPSQGRGLPGRTWCATVRTESTATALAAQEPFRFRAVAPAGQRPRPDYADVIKAFQA